MKKKSQFEKFFNKKSNAAIKEEFRQEKKKWKKEREEYFEKKKQQSTSSTRQPTSNLKPQTSNEQMPLNKFIAHGGLCSRRDAAEMVKLGKVKVNGQLITEPGHKVSAKDDVKVNGKKIFLEKNL